MPTAEAKAAYEIYEKLGVAALFIFMYLATVYFLIKTLIEQKKEIKDIAEKAISTTDKAARNIEDSIKMQEDMKAVIEGSKQQMSEFIAFQKGRDAGGGR